MKTTLVYIFLINCCLNSFSQNYVKLKYDENINLLEKKSFLIGFEYDTKKDKIKKRGKYFKKSAYLGRINLIVIGGEYNYNSGKLDINFDLAKKNNNSIFLIYNHPLNKKIQIIDTLKLPTLNSLKISDDFKKNLYRNVKYVLNFKASFSNGKTKIISNHKIYNFLLDNEINIEINGAEKIAYDLIFVNDSISKFVSIKYTSSKPNFKASIDSFTIAELLDINISSKNFSYDSKNKIVATAYFSNGKQKELSGENLQNVLVGYGINISTKKGEFINGDFSTFKFSETKSDSAVIHLKSDRINKTYIFPLVLDKCYFYSFGGKPTKSNSSIHGNNGKHGNNVTVMISEIVSKKDFFKINISSRGKTESIYLNPNLGNLTIESIGSNGNNGKGGRDGKWEYENSKATPGEIGGIGGDGGDGGNINIHLPKSFGRFIDKILVKNHGGTAGAGGAGGRGGGLSNDEDSTGSFLGDILISLIETKKRLNNGSSGKPGRDGRNGEINFLYY